MQKTRGEWLLEKFVALRFKSEADVDRAIAFVYETKELADMHWDTPDGWELHIPESAEAIFAKSGIAYEQFFNLTNPPKFVERVSVEFVAKKLRAVIQPRSK
jgi:hypothetical protein